MYRSHCQVQSDRFNDVLTTALISYIINVMLFKIIFIIIDCLAVLDLYFITKASEKITKTYGRWLKKTLIAGIIAIFANILIALSQTPAFAQLAFCIYFASINWILYYLVGFCLAYTEHDRALNRMYIYAAVIMGLDSLSILLSPIFHHAFSVYTIKGTYGSDFFQIKALLPYDIHLAIDYIAVMIALVFIIYSIKRSYSFYRMKYVIILSVLLIVVILNVAYMMFALPLDASVIFYALAGTLIYVSIQKLVPYSLMTSSIGRAVDDMNEGLILFDISDNCIYANAFAKNRFEIIPDRYDLSCEPVASVISSLSDKGSSFGEEAYTTNGKDKDGNDSAFSYMIRYNRLNDPKGRIIGSYFLIEDNTEQVHYLNEIRAARDSADEANRAKSTFLANMSHEIRTPLNSILGMNEMILRTAEDPLLTEYAQNIKQSGDTLLGLINDVLDFSRIEANKIDINPTEYRPHDLLRDCWNFFDQMAEAKDLLIEVSCDENIPSALIGDKKLVRQIITNIISNAIKYTKEGSVNVLMDFERTDEENGTLTLRVKDTGIGIAKEDIDNLFDAFKRANEKENATIQGTGLGLAITHDLIMLMNGTIDVESTPGKGSTFTANIPQKISDAAPAGVFVKDEEIKKEAYRESFRAPDADILVVDDAKLNLKVVQALLRKTRIKIDTADGGKRAIEMCNAKKYDLILLDHRMPEPDGIQTFRAIQSDGPNTDTPVIMLTANVVGGAEVEYRKIGFADYLSKPIHGEDLEASLMKHLPKDKIIS